MKQKRSGKTTKMSLRDISESWLVEDLKDPEFAAGYLEDVLMQGSNESFLAALRLVAKANGGMKQLATRTKLGRESMYKALSANGNPHFSTIQSIMKHIGFRFRITPVARTKKAA